MIKICKYCEREFQARINKTYCCKEKECIKKKSQDKYRLKLYLKNCIVCNEKFKAPKQIIICSDYCKKKYKEKNVKIVQKIYCKKCSSFIKENVLFTNIYGKNTISKKKEDKVCKSCKDINFLKWAEKQKGENNTNWKDIKKVRKAKYTNEERKQMMSLFNPMKDEKTRKKVAKSLKEKYEKGEIERPIGRLSPLWKGNRRRSFTIRDRIGWWKKENLERANYKCENCEENRKLEVHHKNTPFRDILSNHLNGRILDDLSLFDFEVLCNEISEYHKNEEGLVVCKKCHSEIDDYRKIKK